MIIIKAEPEEFQAVREFYHSLIDALEGTEYHPKWAKDIYPAPEELRIAIEEKTLYIGMEEDETAADGNAARQPAAEKVTADRIAAAMVVNHKCNEEYADVTWPQELTREEFVVIHMLGVHGRHAGKGYAKEMVRYAIDLAKEWGMKAVRLDVLKGNVPAECLYEGLGFVHVDTIRLFYEDTGRVDFKMYEYGLAL